MFPNSEVYHETGILCTKYLNLHHLIVMIKNNSDIPGSIDTGKLRKNKRVAIFLICLIISTVLWFLNALGKNYNAIISYPVKFINPPENRFLSGKPPLALQLSVEGKGFLLLQHKLLTFSPIKLDISEMIKNSTPVTGIYNVPTQNLKNLISAEISAKPMLILG